MTIDGAELSMKATALALDALYGAMAMPAVKGRTVPDVCKTCQLFSPTVGCLENADWQDCEREAEAELHEESEEER